MHDTAVLPAKTKFAYGIGQVAETIKSTGFDIFLFFYFTQVLGLSGTLAGLVPWKRYASFTDGSRRSSLSCSDVLQGGSCADTDAVGSALTASRMRLRLSR